MYLSLNGGCLKLRNSTKILRDRIGHKGGGVAAYVRCLLKPNIWKFSGDNPMFELLWITVDNLFLGVVYYAPRPKYNVESFLDYLEATVDEVTNNFSASEIVIAGDCNQLLDTELTQRTGLMQIVDQPTHWANTLDRVFVSSPMYTGVKVVFSTVKSDHLAIIAYTGAQPKDINKKQTILQHRPHTPDQHAAFLDHLLAKNWDHIIDAKDTRYAFALFYADVLLMLDTFYPQRAITVTNKDPYFVTPKVKSLLRKRNRPMHK